MRRVLAKAPPGACREEAAGPREGSNSRVTELLPSRRDKEPTGQGLGAEAVTPHRVLEARGEAFFFPRWDRQSKL